MPWTAQDTKQRLQKLATRLAQSAPADRHIFTNTYVPDAIHAAEQLQDRPDTPMNGALISIKDLFDIKGKVTHAGTQFMRRDKPASSDADVVAALRLAGAVIVGHTNMTELAYSGLGLNPHYGTPANVFDAQKIPGGSTSGGALSVARDLVDIAIGTDTGGSLRIPAAFNGIVGFKPTQSTVSRTGCKPLSVTLDSVGPMAKTVAECKMAYDVMRHHSVQPELPLNSEFVIPDNFGFDEIEPAVEKHFWDAVQGLENAGYKVARETFTSLEHCQQLPIWQFAAIESQAVYGASAQAYSAEMDPRVASRMARASEVDAVTYRKTLDQRLRLIEAFNMELRDRTLLLPTTPILPPKLSDLEHDDAYGQTNLLALRNPSIANVLDCCSVSLPAGTANEPIGIMLTATAHRDHALLNVAATVEQTFHSRPV
ncbi:amidase [Epibacterium ulvae]|nr:amidase family protein [Epibacterium ulvae]MBT8153415.1 amidase [Epibacterium ulvae]